MPFKSTFNKSSLSIGFIFIACTMALLMTAGCYHEPDEELPADKSFLARRRTAKGPKLPVHAASAAFSEKKFGASMGNMRPPEPRKEVRVGPEPLDPKKLAGNDACASCHPNEFRNHHESRHNITLREVTARDLGPLMPPIGEIKEGGYQIVAKDEVKDQKKDPMLYFSQDGLVEHGQPLQFALGSGKSGMTYVRVIDAKSIIEMRMSYFPNQKQWGFTPGQMPTPDHAVGMLHEGSLGKGCLLCHAVSLNVRTGFPEPKFRGVGCEACHGPARDHVTAMTSGKTADLHIAKLGTWSAARLNRMCGQCHGNGDDIDPKNTMVSNQTNRFMAYGLMKSRCYLESNKSLSCSTCHNSHTDASKDANFYDSKCLSCHSGNTLHASVAAASAGTLTPAATTPPVTKPFVTTPSAPPITQAKTVCKVNPRSGCVGCHMPTRETFPGLRLPTQMADHFISIKR